MCRIGIITRQNEHTKWGGDLIIYRDLIAVAKALQFEVVCVQTAFDLGEVDFAFYGNTSLPLLDQETAFLHLRKIPYALFAWYKDPYTIFQNMAFPLYVEQFCAISDSLDGIGSYLKEFPQFMQDHFPLFDQQKALLAAEHPNTKALYNACFTIASSEEEKRCIARDFNHYQAWVHHQYPGLTELLDATEEKDISELIGMKTPYFLQIGRFEQGKNQLISLLAAIILEEPILFIATRIEETSRWYFNFCMKLAEKYCLAPCTVLSQDVEQYSVGNVRHIPMPQGRKLPISFIKSAYQRSKLLLHCAFNEAPGFTCLEALKLDVPAVGSTSMFIDGYVKNEEQCLNFARVDPWDLEGLLVAVQRMTKVSRIVKEDLCHLPTQMEYFTQIFRRAKLI